MHTETTVRRSCDSIVIRLSSSLAWKPSLSQLIHFFHTGLKDNECLDHGATRGKLTNGASRTGLTSKLHSKSGAALAQVLTSCKRTSDPETGFVEMIEAPPRFTATTLPQADIPVAALRDTFGTFGGGNFVYFPCKRHQSKHLVFPPTCFASRGPGGSSPPTSTIIGPK